MMKLFYLQHILDTIADGVPCPRCRDYLDDRIMNLKSFNGNDCLIEGWCVNCGAKIEIESKIEDKAPKGVRAIMGVKAFLPGSVARTKLEPDAVKRISESIHNFNGKDIRKLF